MFQAQNREAITSTWKVAASFTIIITSGVTSSFLIKQYQTCKTKTKTDFLVSDRSCRKTDGVRPHQWHLYDFLLVIHSNDGPFSRLAYTAISVEKRKFFLPHNLTPPSNTLSSEFFKRRLGSKT